ncbi:3-methyl-2-oxobutanoate hydroxymethyltransferase [Arcanobacterium hippocoleae]|uniref:3-methyl-2-oxobutanoate hydroxymethyltransferase n=1 Tax=Arcanobacterium hippocoleae TaxID=149017 RepID=A0ABU1T0N5_9ACTO|nr:3-methyl-2-oxobutanoate hydroxymethyltransferase [Arcanobacterium hippocoleae]
MVKKVRAHHFRQMKHERTPITMLTSYDALTARIFDHAGTDMLLVGDSYGNVCLGYDSTVRVTLADMVRATAAVSSAAERAFIVADLPFGSYEACPEEAVHSAVELVRAGAEAVKLEGGRRQAHTINAIVQAGIPVVAHIGYTPQSQNALGGARVQGRGDAAEEVKADALAVEKAGALAVVLEMVPAETATDITASLEIPTIGIGAGNGCDGQVLVWSDMAGMTDWQPSFVQVFGQVGQALTAAALDYNEAVRTRQFPDAQHSFTN